MSNPQTFGLVAATSKAFFFGSPGPALPGPGHALSLAGFDQATRPCCRGLESSEGFWRLWRPRPEAEARLRRAHPDAYLKSEAGRRSAYVLSRMKYLTCPGVSGCPGCAGCPGVRGVRVSRCVRGCPGIPRDRRPGCPGPAGHSSEHMSGGTPGRPNTPGQAISINFRPCGSLYFFRAAAKILHGSLIFFSWHVWPDSLAM